MFESDNCVLKKLVLTSLLLFSIKL